MKRKLLLLLIIWLLAAGLIFVFGPRPAQAPRTAHADAAVWKLPELQLSDAEAAWTELRVRQLWGAPPLPPGVNVKAQAPAPLTPPDWRILATVATGIEQYVIVQIGKTPPVNIKTGEHLPDGSVLARVEPDRLYLVVQGKKRVLRIYPE